MRYFGLLLIVGTLVAVVIILAAPGGYLDYVKQVKQSGDYARGKAEQWAGVDSSGARVSDSIQLAPFPAEGQLRGLVVSNINPGGPMQTYYGLATGDVIIEIGPLVLTDYDFGTARDLASEAYQRQQPLTIRREGQVYVLPRDKSTAPAPAAAPGAPTLPGSATPGGTAVPPAIAPAADK